METKIVISKGLKLHTRKQRSKLDQDVINEVVTYDHYKLQYLKDKIPYPNIILDVGGHIGSFGVYAKSIWPKARLIAIEPNKESCTLYKLNIKENKLKDCEVIEAGIGYNKKRNILVDGYNATGGGYLVTDGDPIVKGLNQDYIVLGEIKLITLEEVIEKYNIESIGLAKWDCEGGELDAFKYMLPETAQKMSYLVGEYHYEDGYFAYKELVETKAPHIQIGTTLISKVGPFWGIPNNLEEPLLDELLGNP